MHLLKKSMGEFLNKSLREFLKKFWDNIELLEEVLIMFLKKFIYKNLTWENTLLNKHWRNLQKNSRWSLADKEFLQGCPFRYNYRKKTLGILLIKKKIEKIWWNLWGRVMDLILSRPSLFRYTTILHFLQQRVAVYLPREILAEKNLPAHQNSDSAHRTQS